MDDLKTKLLDLKERFQKISEQFDRQKLSSEISELETQMSTEGFWNDSKQAQTVSRQLSEKQKLLNSLQSLESRVTDALEMMDEPSMQQDLEKEAVELQESLDELELK